MQQSRAVTRNLDAEPFGDLGIVALRSCREMGAEIDHYIVKWRQEREQDRKSVV